MVDCPFSPQHGIPAVTSLTRRQLQSSECCQQSSIDEDFLYRVGVSQFITLSKPLSYAFGIHSAYLPWLLTHRPWGNNPCGLPDYFEFFLASLRKPGYSTVATLPNLVRHNSILYDCETKRSSKWPYDSRCLYILVMTEINFQWISKSLEY